MCFSNVAWEQVINRQWARTQKVPQIHDSCLSIIVWNNNIVDLAHTWKWSDQQDSHCPHLQSSCDIHDTHEPPLEWLLHCQSVPLIWDEILHPPHQQCLTIQEPIEVAPEHNQSSIVGRTLGKSMCLTTPLLPHILVTWITHWSR